MSRSDLVHLRDLQATSVVLRVFWPCRFRVDAIGVDGMSARMLSFEVYFLQKGRWQIHARFKGLQKDEAIEEAKQLDRAGHIEAVCVLRESVDPVQKTSSESVVYHSPTLKTKPPVSAITSTAPGGRAELDRNAAPDGSAAANAAIDAIKREEAFQQKQHAEIQARIQEEAARELQYRSRREAPKTDGVAMVKAVTSLAMVALFCLIPASVIAYLVYLGMTQASETGMTINPQTGRIVLIGSFILAYGAVFLPMLKKFVDVSTLTAEGGGTATRSAPAHSAYRDDTHFPDEYEDHHDDDGSENAAVPAVADIVPAPGTGPAALSDDEEEPVEAPEPPEPPDENPGKEDLEKDSQPEGVDRADFPDLAAVPVVPPAKAVRDAEGESLNRELERLFKEIQSLFGDTVDDYTRFGLTLFLSGAGEVFARQGLVPKDIVKDRLIERVTKLGATPKMAKGFVVNIAEYLIDDRYFDMYDRGRAGAAGRVDDPTSDSGLREAVDHWRNPAPAAPGSEEEPDDTDPEALAILFTEIVDAEELLIQGGADRLGQAIDAHDEIVRDALEKFDGREIRHAGDGMIVTFPDSAHSVDAAIHMQTAFHRRQEDEPENGFPVRIGINTGQLTSGSGQSGRPVSLAARILTKAAVGEIVVSSRIREAAGGNDRVFEKKGTFKLKAFTETETIYLVNYSSYLQAGKTA